jgi:hypothetical protein
LRSAASEQSGPSVVEASKGSPGVRASKAAWNFCNELIGDLVDDDESFGGHTTLAGVVHAAPYGPLHGLIEFGVFENDEGVAAAQLHRRFLEVLAGLSSDYRTGAFASGHCDSFDPRVVDQMFGLVVRKEEVRVGAVGSASLFEERDKSQRALWNRGRMLHHDDVADHQIRGDEARELIVREVPGLDAEEHADRTALDGCVAGVWSKCLRRQEAFGALGVVVDDVGAESDFTAAFGDELAHLQGDEAANSVGARA